jgi:hypothetical protein
VTKLTRWANLIQKHGVEAALTLNGHLNQIVRQFHSGSSRFEWPRDLNQLAGHSARRMTEPRRPSSWVEDADSFVADVSKVRISLIIRIAPLIS